MFYDATKTYDVGVLGWWYGKNYGSILTYYGLNRAIEGLGKSVLMVHEPLGYNGYRVNWPDDILSMDFAKRAGYHFTQQEHYSKLSSLNSKARTFVVGSDQLWNPLIGRVNDDLFLDFVSDENIRVAYGTSFGNRGTDKFKPPFVEKQAPNLAKFKAISVREKYAIDTARNIFDVNADLVVDPVFLLPRSHYEELAKSATVQLTGSYMAVFFLDPTPAKRDVAVAIADKLGLDRIVIVPNPDNGRETSAEIFGDPRFEILAEDAPENFLLAYQNSSYVITDSFHGTAFSAIFQKPFSSIYNTKRGADRFKNLLSSLGFDEQRRVFETDTVDKIADNPNVTFDIDFTKSQSYIQEEGAASLKWLETALKTDGTPRKATSKVTVLDRATAKLGRVFSSFGSSDTADDSAVRCPTFIGNNDVWQVSKGKGSTKLRVAQGGSVRGNLVWCDLPEELTKGKAYRLTLDWKVHTTGNAINVHLRASSTEKFNVIGKVEVKGRTRHKRSDHIEFIAKDSTLNQIMFGAVHFSGPDAGADIAQVKVEEIPVASIQPKKAGPTHAEKVLEFSISDSKRFSDAHRNSVANKAATGARARIMFHAHAIEKGLSRADFRAGFGKIAVPGLAKEMNAWLHAGRSEDDQYYKSGAAVMASYCERHKNSGVDVSHFLELFDPRIIKMIEQTEAKENGGVIAAGDTRELVADAPENSFLDVVYGRRSIREWNDKPVDLDHIKSAVQIAMQAPSVCNRQAARVHLFDDPKKIKAALKIQGGFSGYAMPPKLMLVTSDLQAFLFSAERNQPFVDGGLFMMTLLLGLQEFGLGSCSLNTAMSPERENQIRKILDIPDNEVFIAFVATGHYDAETLTPVSKRVSVGDILVQH